ncbi:hypothetical protein CWI85_27180, partial [Streptomyces albidoflavus]
MIAVVGHTDLTEDAQEAVGQALRRRLERAPEGMGALVRAARGLPQAYGRAEFDRVVAINLRGVFLGL